MNYFAHGHRYVDDSYFLAGTAVPDWLSVIDRRARARSNLATRPAGRELVRKRRGALLVGLNLSDLKENSHEIRNEPPAVDR